MSRKVYVGHRACVSLADDVPAVVVIASAIIASVAYLLPMICWNTLNAFWPFLEGQ